MLAEGATTEEARAESERLHALRRKPPTGVSGTPEEMEAAEAAWHVPLILSPAPRERERPMQYGVGLPQPERPIERIERFEKLAAGTLESPLALAHHRTDAALKKETEYRRDGLRGRMYSKRCVCPDARAGQRGGVLTPPHPPCAPLQLPLAAHDEPAEHARPRRAGERSAPPRALQDAAGPAPARATGARCGAQARAPRPRPRSKAPGVPGRRARGEGEARAGQAAAEAGGEAGGATGARG